MSRDEAIAALEEEVRLLKNEVKPQLLDIRRRYLDYRLPFRLDKPGEVLGQVQVTPGAWSPRRGPLSEDSGEDVETAESAERGPMSEDSGEEVEMAESAQAANEQAGVRREATAGRAQPPPAPVNGGAGSPGGSGLIAIAATAQWVEEAVTLVGKQRLEALVEVCHMFGHLEPGEKDMVLRLIRCCSCEADGGQATARDYLAMLVRLQKVLGNSTANEDALMAILADDDNGGTSRSWTR